MGNCTGRDFEAVEARAAGMDLNRQMRAVPASRRYTKPSASFSETFLRPTTKSFMDRNSGSGGAARKKSNRFSLSFMNRQESEIPIAEESSTGRTSQPNSSGRKPAPQTPSTDYYRSDTDDDDGVGIDIDLILGNECDSPGVIHARWGEPDPEDEEVCLEYKANPFKLGFCINCQKQHDLDESGEIRKTKEYKRISTFTVWQLQLPANPNISIAPEAVVGVGRINASYSQRKLRLSTLSDGGGGRESDIDLTEILKQRRDILLQLEEAKRQSAVPPASQEAASQPPRPSTGSTRPSTHRASLDDPSWL
ncbi:unnamed protein product [Aphanomyces euteiches]|uniref:Uncharacterized protein n=1 Tax=Aphanomyces euteiches TaxID=100861 RepID=A0A6G0XN28_9STRA|nr:hypothetical protein Ae201684_002989 [Aphanomyces euteiches]KAH9098690.1 hypothetical protein Ae201684P_017901 [Aphanomyces euteiches]KAH9154179.1 hypothetical protein AeRB84_003682 [Aphanomyces euteiches]